MRTPKKSVPRNAVTSHAKADMAFCKSRDICWKLSFMSHEARRPMTNSWQKQCLKSALISDPGNGPPTAH